MADHTTNTARPGDTAHLLLQQALRRVAQIEYMRGWRYGLLCGLVTGLCTTALAVALANTVLAALG